MGRLIDADKLIELYNIMADKFDGMGKSIWEQFAITVEWSPTVDAVEVVRCKDCKYADWWGPKGREVLDCTHLYVPHVTPDWYCAWGERKE